MLAFLRCTGLDLWLLLLPSSSLRVKPSRSQRAKRRRIPIGSILHSAKLENDIAQ